MNNIFDNFDLFIFDLDDTIVKTEKYHYEAWLLTLKKIIDNDYYIDFNFFCSKFHSMIENSIKSYLIDELNIPEKDYEYIYNLKTTNYLKILENNKTNLVLISGLDILLNKIIESSKKFVIVTNTSKCNLDFYLEIFPILQQSSKNYYREMMMNKKPNPECYLKVCNDFPNLSKVAFEDSITGIHALSLVPSISTIFINSSDYYYYDYITKNYFLQKIIINYNF
jgi:beta-phosphoglucomutase-like phosphatase (HAD superfamily)